MLQLRVTRATSTRSWQAICHPPQDLRRTYSILRRSSEFKLQTTSSSPESTDASSETSSTNGIASKPSSLISRSSQRQTPRLYAHQKTPGAEPNVDPDVPGTETLEANQSLIRRRPFEPELGVEPDGRGTEPLGARQRFTRRRTFQPKFHAEPDHRGTEFPGTTSFLSARSAKSRDHATTKWLRQEEKKQEGFVEEYEDEDEDNDEEEDEEDEDFFDDFEDLEELDEMSEDQVAEWERETWAKALQELRDESAAEREVISAATYTDLNELFGPVSAPPDSPRLQALKELGGDYTSYLPPEDADPRQSPITYARLALGRNKQIPLKAQTDALHVIEAAIGGRVTKTG